MVSFKDDDPVPPYSIFHPPPDENTPLWPPQYSVRLTERPQPLRRKWNTNWPRIIVYTLLTLIFFSLVHISLLYSNNRIPDHLLPPGVQPSRPDKQPIRVAIVGAGPAGIAAAFQLSNEFRPKADGRSVEVVVFEQKDSVGGRMVIDADLGEMWLSQSGITTGDLAGGNLLAHESVMKQRAEEYLGMDFGNDWDSEGKTMEVGFFDGSAIVSKISRPLDKVGWLQWASLLWRYGRKIPGAKSISTETMKGFNKLLKTRDTFEGIEEMIEQVEIKQAVTTSAKETLKKDDWSQLYIEEVVEQQVRRQFGQGTDEISDLALNMALKRERQIPRVGGMLEDVLAQFLANSRAEVRLSTKVTNVGYESANGKKNGGWRLDIMSGTHATEIFDKVIIASPWNTTLEGYYRNVWTAFIVTSGQLNASYFGFDSDGNSELPAQILVIDSPALAPELRGVREINYVKDIYGPDVGALAVHKLYRVQSDQQISEDLVAQFGGNEVVRAVHVEIPYAYPLLFPRSEELGTFRLEDGLFSTGVMEMIASSVDTSWIAGENVARLIKREIREEENNV